MDCPVTFGWGQNVIFNGQHTCTLLFGWFCKWERWLSLAHSGFPAFVLPRKVLFSHKIMFYMQLDWPTPHLHPPPPPSHLLYFFKSPSQPLGPESSNAETSIVFVFVLFYLASFCFFFLSLAHLPCFFLAALLKINKNDQHTRQGKAEK